MAVAALTMISASITLHYSLIIASAILMIATATLTPLMIFQSLGEDVLVFSWISIWAVICIGVLIVLIEHRQVTEDL